MSEVIETKRLLTIVERTERLMEEQKGLAESIKDIMTEAKSSGLEPKYIKRAIRERSEDSEKRRMGESEYQMYREALGID